MSDNDDPFDMDVVEPEFTTKKRATEKRADTDIIVQHPVKKEVPEELDVEAEFIETMGLSVAPPNDAGVLTIQNTASDSVTTDRFVAFDVALIDELIHALVEAKVRHDGEPPEATRPTGATRQEVRQAVEDALAEANRSVRGGTHD